MLLKKQAVCAGKQIIMWMLVCMLMLCTASAEKMVETPAAAAAEQVEIPIDPVNENGTQLHTGPVLMVTDYTVIQGETVPGSSFVLQMNIANLSEYAAAYNVMATLTIENTSVALQQGTTNQVYFHEIPPMQSVEVQFPLEVYSYCTDENMILTMTMTCVDAYVVQYDFQTMMTPNVDVLRTLHIGSLTVPQFVHRNSSMMISATLANVEPVILNRIRMHVITQYGEQITEAGQLLSGESKTVNSIYRFPEQQTEKVQVYFTYENLSGHEFATELQDFEVVVYDPTVQNDFVSDGSLNVRAMIERLASDITISGTDVQIPLPVIVLILVGCIGYGVILYCVFRRKRK